MDHLLNAVTLFSLVLAAVVLLSVRHERIRVEYSVSWLGAAITLLVLSRSKGLLAWLGAAVGVSDTPLALLMIVFCVFLGVFYRFSTIISRLKDSNIAMAQRLAILEYQIEVLNEAKKTS